MSYELIYDKAYEKIQTLSAGGSLQEKVEKQLDNRYRYKVRLRGEVGIPFNHRTEATFPVYFRKLDDSLSETGGEYALSFEESNLEYERSCYQMVRGDFKVNETYTFGVTAKISGAKDNFALTAEVYYGDSKTRYYYEKPDEVHTVALTDCADFTAFEKQIMFREKVDFVMIKLSAIDFKGEALVKTPSLACNGENLVLPYEYAPLKLGEQAWIGEGFSKSNRPTFRLFVNGVKVFEGRKSDRLHHFAGVEFVIPDGALKEKDNEFTLTYGEGNYYDYLIKNFQLITLPKQTELLAVAPYQVKGQEFGVLCHFEKSGKITVNTSEQLQYLGEETVEAGMQALRFAPIATGANAWVEVSDGVVTRKITVKNISEKKEDYIKTGSGDFIYVNQNTDDFYEYLAWYLNENIGDMFTLRSCYRWGATAEADPVFWEKAIAVLKKLGVYYVLMIDGRELNGVNANPPVELLDSEYFLGEQTHERDGAFTYWTQETDEYEEFFYHLLSRKLKRNGIYGRYSPVYNKKGEGRIYYAGDNVSNVKEAYEELVKNLRRTAAEGATRHTGVTPLFHAFLDAGYKWVGYESMYGAHEVILGALRGMSNSVGQKLFGTHAALQWSTMPSSDPAHIVRYRLSLWLSYMHGVSHINTEEGLWTIETPFADYDRYSYACTKHREEQQKLNAFIKTHTRRGKQVRNIAMMVGQYDGMDCFSTGKVYGQAGESWKYAAPEDSWDLLNVFYPQSKLGALYYFVKKGGATNMQYNEQAYIDERLEIKTGAKDYESLGYYTETPYGVIDLIAGDATNLNDYKAIFLTGWNTCSEEQIQRLCAFMDNGGKVLLGKAHLYENVSREEVFAGKGKIVESPWTEKLLSHKNLEYFDRDGYPADYAEDYRASLNALGKAYASKYIENTKFVSFTEFAEDSGATTLYLLDINWWNDEPATCDLKLGDHKYTLTLGGNTMRVLYVSPNGEKAVLMDNDTVDFEWLSDDEYRFIGNDDTKYTLFVGGKRIEKTEIKAK